MRKNGTCLCTAIELSVALNSGNFKTKLNSSNFSHSVYIYFLNKQPFLISINVFFLGEALETLRKTTLQILELYLLLAHVRSPHIQQTPKK